MKKPSAGHISQLRVTLGGRLVGILARGEDKRIWFEYDPGWLASGFNLAPRTMDFATGAQLAKGDVFGGLHGAFSDSLPDGWGLLLMDREFKRRFDWNPRDITPLDRLAYIGSRAMGALEYAPAYEQERVPDEVDLSALAKSVEAVLQGKESDVLAQLRIQGGSPGGARPKVTVARTAASAICLSGFQTLPEGYAHWIVKFRSKEDPVDMGRIERAYAEMASLAGVSMPKADLIAVGNGNEREWYFAVERFDRFGQNGKRHVLSLAGLLYADFRLPCMDYDSVLATVGALTQDRSQVEHAFRLMTFNVLAHNRDDHVKNFAFVHHGNEGWKLSPAFDLTFSTGMGGEHTTAINGQGQPGLEHVLAIGRKHRIANAERIVGEVRHAVAQWPALAEKWAVTRGSTIEIQEALAKVAKRF
ncbi:MAG: serine/threonine-protein kinase HipA [Pseudomonadota bacterium]|nr:serine/threonine-protein kinase HipA [Pseudomonadota bacterium]